MERVRNLVYEGAMSHPCVNSGEPIPVYRMGGYINTEEGWNMAARHGINSEAYRAAKADWMDKSDELMSRMGIVVAV